MNVLKESRVRSVVKRSCGSTRPHKNRKALIMTVLSRGYSVLTAGIVFLIYGYIQSISQSSAGHIVVFIFGMYLSLCSTFYATPLCLTLLYFYCYVKNLEKLSFYLFLSLLTLSVLFPPQVSIVGLLLGNGGGGIEEEVPIKARKYEKEIRALMMGRGGDMMKLNSLDSWYNRFKGREKELYSMIKEKCKVGHKSGVNSAAKIDRKSGGLSNFSSPILMTNNPLLYSSNKMPQSLASPPLSQYERTTPASHPSYSGAGLQSGASSNGPSYRITQRQYEMPTSAGKHYGNDSNEYDKFEHYEGYSRQITPSTQDKLPSNNNTYRNNSYM